MIGEFDGGVNSAALTDLVGQSSNLVGQFINSNEQ